MNWSVMNSWSNLKRFIPYGCTVGLSNYAIGTVLIMNSGYRFTSGSDTFNFSGGVIPNYYGETLIEALDGVQSVDELRAYNLDRLKGTDNMPLVPTQVTALSKSVNVKHGFGLGAFHGSDLDEALHLDNDRNIIRPTNIKIKYPNAPEGNVDIPDNITLLCGDHEEVICPIIQDDRWFEHRSIKYTALDMDASALMTGMPTFRDKREAASGLEFCRVVQNVFDVGQAAYMQSNLNRIGCLWADARTGTSYVRFFTKMWLDMFSCAAMGNMDVVMSDLDEATGPEAFICNKGPVGEDGHGGEEAIFDNLGSVTEGNTFILDMTGVASAHLKNIAYTYAGKWPRRTYSRRNHHETPIAQRCLLTGATKICVHIGARVLPDPIEFTYIAHRSASSVLDDIRMFVAHVNGVEDAMIGLEIASLMAFGCANRVRGSLLMDTAVGDDRARYVISRLGLYKDEIVLPVDATAGEYFRPMVKPLDKTKHMFMFMSRSINVLINYGLYFATCQSIALTWALYATSLPAGCFAYPPLANSVNHRLNLIYKNNCGSFSPLHTVWLNASALLYGMRPHKMTLLSLDFTTLVEANNDDRTAMRFHRKHAVPINTMWFTIYKYMFCMPDFLALPNENTVVKWPKNKPLPLASSRGYDNDFRLGATLALVEERPWLGDGGAGYSAQFYASISADGVVRESPTGMTFKCWNKPHQYELPANTVDVVVRRLPGALAPFLIPGQLNGYNHTARFTRAFGVHYDTGNSMVQSIAKQHKAASVYITLRPGERINRETDDVIYALIDYINAETKEQTYELISITDAPTMSGERGIREKIGDDAIMGEAALANDNGPNEPSRNGQQYKNRVLAANTGATNASSPKYVVDYQKNKVRSIMNKEAINKLKQDAAKIKMSVGQGGNLKYKKQKTNDHANDKNIFKNTLDRKKMARDEQALRKLEELKQHENNMKRTQAAINEIKNSNAKKIVAPVKEDVINYFENENEQQETAHNDNTEHADEKENENYVTFDSSKPNSAMLQSAGSDHELTAEAPQLSMMEEVNFTPNDGHLIGSNNNVARNNRDARSNTNAKASNNRDKNHVNFQVRSNSLKA